LEIKKIVKDSFSLEDLELPSWLSSNIINKNAKLSSYLWSSTFVEKIRLCELKIGNKFCAESLVIYPKKESFLPIFGTEFLNISNRKYFGAIDFHPISEDKLYLSYLKDFPNTKVNNLKRYNINRFFSEKFWIKRSNIDFYSEYCIWVKCYLHQYKKVIESGQKGTPIDKYPFREYNTYMSSNDPAFGILKSYFSESFAEDYINNFLFC